MSDPATSGRRVRGGGRAARLALREAAPAADRKPIWAGMEGGSYNPLSARDLERIHDAALRLACDDGRIQRFRLRAVHKNQIPSRGILAARGQCEGENCHANHSCSA